MNKCCFFAIAVTAAFVVYMLSGYLPLATGIYAALIGNLFAFDSIVLKPYAEMDLLHHNGTSADPVQLLDRRFRSID